MDADVMREFALRKERERDARAAARRERLLQAVPRLARVLRRGFGARAVTLFGSLAWGHADEHADIDIFVTGLAPGRYFEALGRLLAEAPCSVDLVREEDAPETLKRRVAEGGVRFHERH